MDESQERAFYRDNIESLKRHTGRDLKGILTPAITNTERTPALIAESGMIYHADWVHDDVPVPILVPGHRLISLPYSYDLNDAPLWDGRPYGGPYFVQACKDAFDRLYAESALRWPGILHCAAPLSDWAASPHWSPARGTGPYRRP